MSDFATLAANLGAYTHASGDSVVLKEVIIMALKDFRVRQTAWSQGSFNFVCEDGVNEYPVGDYPRIPGGLMSLITTPHVSHGEISGAVIKPDTLVSSTNLTGDITDVQDSAQKPDDDYLDPSSAANTSFEVRWDLALPRPLVPGEDTGFDKQIMRVSAYNEGTDRAVAWTLKESGGTIATGIITVNSSTPTPYTIEWDAALLSTLNPATNTISLLLEDNTTAGEVHFGAVQWFTHTRIQRQAVTGGQRPMSIIQQQVYRELSGGRVEVVVASPTEVALFNERLYLYPTPNGEYLLTIDYMMDSTRDETTNALLTTSSTTETNEWFRRGYQELLTKSLEKYYALRPHDAKAAAMAGSVARDARRAQELEHEILVFNGPPTGHL